MLGSEAELAAYAKEVRPGCMAGLGLISQEVAAWRGLGGGAGCWRWLMPAPSLPSHPHHPTPFAAWLGGGRRACYLQARGKRRRQGGGRCGGGGAAVPGDHLALPGLRSGGGAHCVRRRGCMRPWREPSPSTVDPCSCVRRWRPCKSEPVRRELWRCPLLAITVGSSPAAVLSSQNPGGLGTKLLRSRMVAAARMNSIIVPARLSPLWPLIVH